MHASTTLKLAAAGASLLLAGASGWSFSAWDAAGCDNSTAASTSIVVEGLGNEGCNPVPSPKGQQSLRGDIPAASACRINFYPAASCGGRVAFSLTRDSTDCFYIGDFLQPLAYYQVVDCA
ncbi:hypothetical protein GGR54DRAFT_609007 [Hypoxylon sp. NC1633]|nr:hypothetical protein GGR54DRAFT_609007 [Hypoxylon sp. NC1633]